MLGALRTALNDQNLTIPTLEGLAHGDLSHEMAVDLAKTRP